MEQYRTYGSDQNVHYGFAKTFVHDLDAMHTFYTRVFGLKEMFRHEDTMLGREIAEIGYMPSREGGPSLTLIKYKDSAEPVVGEAVQGFTTEDLHGVIERALAAGGSVPEGVYQVPSFGISVAFVIDPEGHVNEVVQADGA